MDFSRLTELDNSELIDDRLLTNFAIKLNLIDQSCLAGMTIPQQIDAVENELKSNPQFASVIAHAFNMHLMTCLTSAALKLTKKSLERLSK